MEDLFSILIHKSHAIIGTIAFIGGITAFFTEKGSKIHIIAGCTFAIGMLYSAVTVAYFMVEDFRPLAIVLSLATIYFTLSSISV